MNDSCIIRSVLNADPFMESTGRWPVSSTGHMEDTTRVRALARRLDQRSRATVYNHPDTWRTRFRRLDIDFALPDKDGVSISHDSKTWAGPTRDIKFMTFWYQEDLIAIVVKETRNLPQTPADSNEVLFYSLMSSMRPIFIGSITCSTGSIHLTSMELLETSSGTTSQRSWKVMICLDTAIKACTITTRTAYADDESPFDFEVLSLPSIPADNILLRQGKAEPDVSNIFEPTRKQRQAWELLTELPIWIVHCLPTARVNVRGDFPDHQDRLTLINCYLAKDVESGSLYLVQVGKPFPDMGEVLEASTQHTRETTKIGQKDFGSQGCNESLLQRSREVRRAAAEEDGVNSAKDRYRHVDFSYGDSAIRPIASISSSNKDCVFQNIAASPSTGSEDVVRFTVIWQNCSQNGQQRPELYIYDVPTSIFSAEQLHQKRNQPATSSGQSSTTHGLPAIHGKRMTSLNPGIGGIHPHSPLWETTAAAQTSTAQYKRQAVLGGLHMTTEGPPKHSFLNRSEQPRCLVWGPSTTGITLSIFHLDSTRRDFPPRSDIFCGTHHPDAIIYQPLNHLCACHLHDYGYRVALPLGNSNPNNNSSPTTSIIPPPPPLPPPTKSLLDRLVGLRAAPYPEQQQQQQQQQQRRQKKNPIEQYDPPARAAAFKRQEDAYRAQIRAMKRSGMSNEEIADRWNNGRWSRWGAVRKPDGWRGILPEGDGF